MSPTLPASLSDADLLVNVKHLAASERRATAELVAALAELDSRRLYLAQGCSSLFTYCTQVLHLSEQAAYLRIQAARTSRRFPLVLDRLAAGDLTLTTVGLLAPHLTEANHAALVDETRHQGRRAVEEIVARLRPQPDVPASIRKAPVRSLVGGICGGEPVRAKRATAAERAGEPTSPPGALELRGREHGPSAPPSLPSARETPRAQASLRPLAPSRYHLHVTISAETHAKLRHAQDLLRHALPDGDPAAVLDRALTLLVERLERDRAKATRRPRRDEAKRRSQVGGADNHPIAPPPPSADAVPHGPSDRKRPGQAETDDAAPRNENGNTAGSRRIRAATVRAVWARDEGRCAFIGSEGRCRETAFLELHHIVPVARGGAATTANLALRCHAHNQGEALRDFGEETVAAARAVFRRERGEATSVTLFDTTLSDPQLHRLQRLDAS